MAQQILLIPIRNDLPAYSYQITLESVVYTLTFRFNARMNRWLMDIADQTENPICMGLPMLVNFPLIERFQNDSLPPGSFLVLDESGNNQNPDRDSWSNNVKLFYQTAV